MATPNDLQTEDLYGFVNEQIKWPDDAWLPPTIFESNLEMYSADGYEYHHLWCPRCHHRTVHTTDTTGNGGAVIVHCTNPSGKCSYELSSRIYTQLVLAARIFRSVVNASGVSTDTSDDGAILSVRERGINGQPGWVRQQDSEGERAVGVGHEYGKGRQSVRSY